MGATLVSKSSTEGQTWLAWIPAFAGMTGRGSGQSAVLPLSPRLATVATTAAKNAEFTSPKDNMTRIMAMDKLMST